MHENIEYQTGHEVAGIAALTLISYLKKRDYVVDDILYGLTFTEQQLKKKGARISWQEFHDIFQNIEDRLHFTDTQITQMGAEAVTESTLKGMALLTRSLLTLPEVYAVMTKGNEHGPGASIITCMDFSLTKDDNLFTLKIAFHEGYKVSRSYLLSTKGTLSAVPELYGLERIEVDFKEVVDGAIYTFICPKVGGVLSGLRRGLERIFQHSNYKDELKAAYQEVYQQNRQLENKLIALRRTQLELERASRAKADFLARVTHEIRTPMNGIYGMNQILANTTLNDDQKECVEAIRNSSEHLIEVVNGILDFSKIDAGKRVLEVIPFCAYDVMQTVSESFRLESQNSEILFISDYDSLEGLWFEGDPTAFRQILFNVLNNAFKFTGEGSVTLSGHFDKALQLVISDTGIGISEEKQEEIFESFSQADAAKTRYYGGTGLGLTVCKSLIDMMGGGICLESALEKGASFYLTLPLPKILSEQPFSAEDITEDFSLLEGKEVLVAEDNTINQKVLEAFLQSVKCEVTLVQNGMEALEAAKIKTYDLILMDIMMPEMDGDEATQRIRSLETGGSVPILALTANAMDGDEEHYLSLGMNGYIAKPIHRDELFRLMQKQLLS